MTDNAALVVVDLQNDFCPGGALPVKDGDKIVAQVNKVVDAFEADDLPVVFTRDWHPRAHCSFKNQGGVWPPHCVQRTWGAKFHSSLIVPADGIIINKATRRDEEAYSGFQGTHLAERLRRSGVKNLFVCGLATDYCVKNTVLDAIDLGFKTHVITDCIKGVNLKRGDSTGSLSLMVARGARRTTSRSLLKEMNRRVAVSSSS